VVFGPDSASARPPDRPNSNFSTGNVEKQFFSEKRPKRPGRPTGPDASQPAERVASRRSFWFLFGRDWTNGSEVTVVTVERVF